MVAPVDGGTPAKRLFFDRGQDSDLHWSPDGTALAFVSTRTDHSFIGIYRNDATPIQYLAPTTSQDSMPRWSPDGASVAFVRLRGDGGPPQNPLNWNPVPWQIWVADARSGSGRLVWASSNTPRGSLPQSGLGPLFEWVAGNRLVFHSERDNWPHLYRCGVCREVRLLARGTHGHTRARYSDGNAADARSFHGRRCLGRAGSAVRRLCGEHGLHARRRRSPPRFSRRRGFSVRSRR